MNVVALPSRAPGRLLTKKQLAQALGRSTRWIELRMREGLPSEPRATPGEHARYDLAKVQTWIAHRDSMPVVTLERRVATLEKQVASLSKELQGRKAG